MSNAQEQENAPKKERTPAQQAAAAKLVEMNRLRRAQAEAGSLGGQASTVEPKAASGKTQRKGGAAGTAASAAVGREMGETARVAPPLGIPDGTLGPFWVQECIQLAEKYHSVGNLYTLAASSWGQNNTVLAEQYTLVANRMTVEANNLQTNFRSATAHAEATRR